MAEGDYDIGDKPRIAVVFRADGNPADPSEVIFQIKHSTHPTYTEYVYGVDDVIERSGIGAYFVDFEFTLSGRWSWRWEANGSVETAEETEIRVRRSRVLGR